MMPYRSCLMGLTLALAACAAEPPKAQGVETAHSRTPAKLEPAPRPFVHAVRRGGTGGGADPIPPKMPVGTGAVPVGGGVARGSITTGFREAF